MVLQSIPRFLQITSGFIRLNAPIPYVCQMSESCCPCSLCLDAKGASAPVPEYRVGGKAVPSWIKLR